MFLNSLINENNLDILELLILKFINIINTLHCRVYSPLHAAVANSNLGAVELLLENGFNVNSKNKMEATPLLFAIVFGKNQKNNIKIIGILRLLVNT